MEANTSLHNGDNARPLFIDFELHTDGDVEFKKELISLMIDDIWELYHAQRNGTETFLKICHKIKATLEILNDKDLNEVITQLRNPAISTQQQEETLQLFNSLCEALVKSLQREAA
jgi:hypothetical protein